jgi:hypothetical protein
MIFDFKLFELSYETYMKASEKAKKLHNFTLSKKFSEWALLSGQSKFSLNSPISNGAFFFSEFPQLPTASSIRSVKQKAYLYNIGVDTFIYDDPLEFDAIAILANFVFTDHKDNVLYPYGPNHPIVSPFAILFPIEWKKDERDESYFSIRGEYKVTGWNETHPVLFYDKESSNKFKRIFSDFKNLLKNGELRSFFIEWSTPKDFDKFLSTISKIKEKDFIK